MQAKSEGMTIVRLRIDDQVEVNLLVSYLGKDFLTNMFLPLMTFPQSHRPMSFSLSQWGSYHVLVASSHPYTFSPDIFTCILRLIQLCKQFHRAHSIKQPLSFCHTAQPFFRCRHHGFSDGKVQTWRYLSMKQSKRRCPSSKSLMASERPKLKKWQQQKPGPQQHYQPDIVAQAQDTSGHCSLKTALRSLQDEKNEDREVLTDSAPDTLLSLRKAHVGDSHRICPDPQLRGVVYRPRASESHVTSATR